MQGLIIIPAYNEAGSIQRVLENVKHHIPHSVDVVVVNDCSKDETVEEVKKAGIPCLDLPCNLRYTGALKTGLQYGLKKEYDWFAFMDADGQHRPEDMRALIENFESNGADLMVGSRWLDPSPEQKSSSGRRAGMLFFSWLTEKLTGKVFTDTTNGMKILNRSIAAELCSHNFGDFHAETLIYLSDRGYKIEEHPITVEDRTTGESMYSFRDVLFYPAKNLILIAVFKLNSWALKKVK